MKEYPCETRGLGPLFTYLGVSSHLSSGMADVALGFSPLLNHSMSLLFGSCLF